MGVSIEQYRAAIGCFNIQSIKYISYTNWLNILLLFNVGEAVVLLCLILLILSGDIELNPGPFRVMSYLSICHINIEGLSEIKLASISNHISNAYDIITLSETWLKNHSVLPLHLNGFQPILRRDREDRQRGGVAVYVSGRIPVKRRADLELPDIEILWTEVRVRTGKLLLATCYRPPDSLVSFWDSLQESVDQAKQTGITQIILTGDLNADPTTFSGRKLAAFCNDNNLSVHINEPTRITPNSESILDQFLSNIPDCITDTQVLPPVSVNDHCTAAGKLRFQVMPRKSYQRHTWQYNQANFNLFRQSLAGADWDTCFESDDIDVVTRRWTDTLLNIARECIPNKTVTIRQNDKPWYTSDLRRQKRAKDRYFNIARRNKTADAWERYRNSRTSYYASCQEAKSLFDKKLTETMKSGSSLSPKKWWSLAKHFLGITTASSYPPMEDDNDELVVDDLSKAELFNNFFLSHSNIDTSGAVLPPPADCHHDKLESITVSENDVLQILKSLNPNKATGPDGVSPKLLKEGAPAIAPSLTKLINMSLRLCKVPTMLKQANVVALHKKLSRSDVSNYRPISLLSCTSKVMEKCVFKYVFNYFRDHSLITKFQSGFIPQDSTVNQLVNLYHMFSNAIDQKKDVRIVFCDITKAFDRVWHEGLIYKLQKIGIGNHLLHWFKNYLSNRQQRIVINGDHSSWGHVKAGVPQGSVLGPLLFLVYINDITDNISTNIRLFADDTALFIDVDDPAGSTNLLNNDLGTINAWADKWLVKFSVPKTKSMIMTLNPNAPPYQPLKMNDVTLTEVQEHKHLGVTLTKNLSWSVHITNISNAASKRLDIMTGLKNMLDRNTLEIMYKSFVRPLLEYSDMLWDGCFQKDADKLEVLQHRAGRIVSGAIRGTPTVNVYRELGWEPLHRRRERHKLMLYYKIVHGMTPSFLTDLLPPSVGTRTQYNLRNAPNLTGYSSRTETFKRSFFPSTTHLWNSLPVEVRQLDNINSFKRFLNQDLPRTRPWYSVGDRRSSVIHARLRMGCSNLNQHLFNLHVTDDPGCICGYRSENSSHYLLHCPLYGRERNIRDAQLFNLDFLSAINIDEDLLLFGSDELTLDQNALITSIVKSYLNSTSRFI